MRLPQNRHYMLKDNWPTLTSRILQIHHNSSTHVQHEFNGWHVDTIFCIRKVSVHNASLNIVFPYFLLYSRSFLFCKSKQNFKQWFESLTWMQNNFCISVIIKLYYFPNLCINLVPFMTYKPLNIAVVLWIMSRPLSCYITNAALLDSISSKFWHWLQPSVMPEV